MKRKLMIIGIMILLIFINSIIVHAALENTVQMQTSEKEVKVGGTFTVTIKATSPDGINGVVTTYSYDDKVLELVDEDEATNFTNLGSGTELFILYKGEAENIVNEVNAYTMTFKVKEGAEVGASTKVSFDETILRSLSDTNNQHEIDAQYVEITIVGEGEAGGEGDDGSDDGNNEGSSDGSEGGNETPPSETLPKEEGSKDQSTAGDNYNHAGTNTILLVIAGVVVIIAIVFYKKNKKYGDIR